MTENTVFETEVADCERQILEKLYNAYQHNIIGFNSKKPKNDWEAFRKAIEKIYRNFAFEGFKGQEGQIAMSRIMDKYAGKKLTAPLTFRSYEHSKEITISAKEMSEIMEGNNGIMTIAPKQPEYKAFQKEVDAAIKKEGMEGADKFIKNANPCNRETGEYIAARSISANRALSDMTDATINALK